jgi:plasmid stabilization system protein ParE
MQIIVRPSAAADIDRAFAWYEHHREGERFLAAVESALEQAMMRPEAPPFVHRDVRRVFLKRFPYGLFYRLESGSFILVACFHSRRAPRDWKRRR